MATIAAQTVASGATGSIIPLSRKNPNFKVAFMITPVDASCTPVVEVCLQPFKGGEAPNPIRWASLEDFTATAYTTPTLGNVWGPVTAIRFKSTTGSFIYDIIQGGDL